MNAFQNGASRTSAIQSPRHCFHGDAQPSALERKERDGSERGARHERALRTDVIRLSTQTEDRARSLIKRRCTMNDCLHWQTRGRQALLRQAATHLLNIAATYRTEYTLFLALRDYLGCLEKYDVDEEPRRPVMNRTSLIMQWKGEGAARELSVLRDRLAQLLKKYPFVAAHILSINRKETVALQE